MSAKRWTHNLLMQFSCIILLSYTIPRSRATSDVESRLAVLETLGKGHVQLLTKQAEEIQQLRDELQTTKDELQIYKQQTKQQADDIRDLKIQVSAQNTRLKDNRHNMHQTDKNITSAIMQMTRQEERNDVIELPEEVNDPITRNTSRSNTGHVIDTQTTSRKRLVLGGITEGVVAFYATTDTPTVTHVGLHQNIVLDLALLNLGNSYHNQHGIFIAPLDGVFVFSVSVMASNDQSHAEIKVGIVKNGVELGVAYAHSDGNRHDQGAVTVITQLVKDDEVWIHNHYPADASYYGARFTTFCGHLLY